jgi:hypothetical protein
MQHDYHALYGDTKKAPADESSAHQFSDLKYFPVNDGNVGRTCHV